jgi:hypothetical protein
MQILSQLDFYEIKCGCYVGGDYSWVYDSLPAPVLGGAAHDTLFDLHPNSWYTCNIKTYDKRNLSSEWALDVFDSVLVGARDFDPKTEPADTLIPKLTTPANFTLIGNYPNPFNLSTTIKMELPYALKWKLSIYDITGRIIKVLNGVDEAGIIAVQWNARDMPSGIYLCKAEAAGFTATQKMLLLK